MRIEADTYHAYLPGACALAEQVQGAGWHCCMFIFDLLPETGYLSLFFHGSLSLPYPRDVQRAKLKR